MTSDKNLLNLTLEDRVRAIHNDIVAIWNIRDLDKVCANSVSQNVSSDSSCIHRFFLVIHSTVE